MSNYNKNKLIEQWTKIYKKYFGIDFEFDKDVIQIIIPSI